MFVRMKKIIAAVFVMIFLFGTVVQAERNTEFHVENKGGKKGDIVTVPVQFNTGEEVGGFQISIYYDKDVMEFQSLKQGNLIIDNIENGGGIFDYNHIEEDAEIIVVYVVADTVKDEGVIVDLNFKLKQDCGESLPIGMGVDDMIDGSEGNNALTGIVSGVDEQFQEEIMKERTDDTSTEMATGDTDDRNAGDIAVDAVGSDEEKEQPPEKDGADTTAAEDNTTDRKSEATETVNDTDMQDAEAGTDKETYGNIAPVIAGTVIILGIVAVVLAVVLKKEKRRGKKRRKRNEED